MTSLTGQGTHTPPPGLPALGALPPGIYQVDAGEESELVALYWDPAEHGRLSQTGPPVTAPPSREQDPEPEEQGAPWWLLAAFGLLWIEFGVVPR